MKRGSIVADQTAALELMANQVARARGADRGTPRRTA
jgi:hypothetical protein